MSMVNSYGGVLVDREKDVLSVWGIPDSNVVAVMSMNLIIMSGVMW